MTKKITLFALFPMLLTACSHSLVEVEIEKENVRTAMPVSTVVSTPTTASISIVSTPMTSLAPIAEKGWIPETENTRQTTPTVKRQALENRAKNTTSPIATVETALRTSVSSATLNHRKVEEDIYTAEMQENPEVVRYDRYLLVEAKPTGGQKYLLEQVVNVKMKGTALTVEQGMWNTLNGTGYSLCRPSDIAVRELFRLPLPKVHYQFGPTKLREAMQMLAGDAFQLTLNDALRQVCYLSRQAIPEKPQPKNRVFVDTELH